tara:strand:+ start:843 stop:1235 length:393 start_codon:yes stop_codon:yes gene_type:complete
MIHLSNKYSSNSKTEYSNIFGAIVDFLGNIRGSGGGKGNYPLCNGVNYPDKDACRRAKYECKYKKDLHWSKGGGRECYVQKYLEITGQLIEPEEEIIEPKKSLSKDSLIGIGIGVVSLFVIIGVTIKRNL